MKNFLKLLSASILVAMATVAFVACEDDDGGQTEDKYCANKADGVFCSDEVQWCFCYHGKSIHAEEILCHEYPCSASCEGKNTADSCGDNRICDPGGACIVPEPYKF
ncbi:MAG: hypothetical protein IJU23_04040 [Proteobacteria bacterium]|nr:hypothetical protein [Pseudomonadota bacterium]